MDTDNDILGTSGLEHQAYLFWKGKGKIKAQIERIV